jgi:hypothetical protein
MRRPRRRAGRRLTVTGGPATTSRRGLVLGLALGVPVIAYGLRGVVVDAGDTHPAELARWMIGSAVVNDLVLVPAALGVAWTLRRLTPAAVWPPLRAGLFATGVLCLVAWPFVRGYGADPTNPSVLPRDYGAGLAAAIAVAWLVTGAWMAGRLLAQRRRRSSVRR